MAKIMRALPQCGFTFDVGHSLLYSSSPGDYIRILKNQIQQQLIASGMQNMNKDIDKFVDNYLKHNKGENYLKIFNELKSNKVFNHIKEKVTITKKSITFDKFKLLAKKI